MKSTTKTRQKSPKLADFFHCEKCDYKCSKKSDYEKHLKTKKHITTKYNKVQHENSPHAYSCECGKSYSHRATLYNHKKKCKLINSEIFDKKNEKNEKKSEKNEKNEKKMQKIEKKLQ